MIEPSGARDREKQVSKFSRPQALDKFRIPQIEGPRMSSASAKSFVGIFIFILIVLVVSGMIALIKYLRV
jgi:hypothetical protein